MLPTHLCATAINQSAGASFRCIVNVHRARALVGSALFRNGPAFTAAGDEKPVNEIRMPVLAELNRVAADRNSR